MSRHCCCHASFCFVQLKEVKTRGATKSGRLRHVKSSEFHDVCQSMCCLRASETCSKVSTYMTSCTPRRMPSTYIRKMYVEKIIDSSDHVSGSGQLHEFTSKSRQVCRSVFFLESSGALVGPLAQLSEPAA